MSYLDQIDVAELSFGDHSPPPLNPLLVLQKSLEIESCPYQLDTDNDNAIQIDVINWLLSRIRDQRLEISQRDDQLTVCRGELNYTENRNEVLMRDKERALGQAGRFQELERKSSQLNNTITARYKQCSEELARHKSQSTHLQTQYVHESRKREKESQRLKERLEQILSDKSKDEKRSLEVLNALKKSRAESGRAKWNVEGKDEMEMYQSLIRQYEEKQKDLLAVIDSMRQALLETDGELSGLLSLSPQPAPAQGALGCEEQWGPVLRQKVEALKERLNQLAAGAAGKTNEVVLDHSFSAEDSVLNSISPDS